MAKTFEMAFKLGAKLSSDFNKTFQGAQGAMGDLRKELRDVSSQASDISGLLRQKEALEKATKAHADAKSRVDELTSAIEEGEKPTKQQAKALEKAQRASKSTANALAAQEAKVSSLTAALDANGKSTSDLEKDQERLQMRSAELREHTEKLASVQRDLANEEKKRTKIRKGLVKTLAVGATLGVAVKANMDLQESIRGVGRSGGFTQDELAKLNDSAREIGRTTTVSAADAASAMDAFANAGWSVKDTQDAARAAVSLATASNLDAKDAAKMTADAMVALGVGASASSPFVDLLAKASAEGGTSVEKMTEAMKEAGPTVRAAGLSAGDTAAFLQGLAKSGIEGGRAGRTLQRTLQRLQKPSSVAQEALRELEVSTTDSSGEMRNMAHVLNDLSKATAGMSDVQRSAVLSDIFGAKTAERISDLIGAPGGLEDLSKALVDSQGYAGDLADEASDNLLGDLKKLRGASMDLVYTIGEALTPAVRGASEWMAETAAKVSKWNSENPELASTIAKVVAILAGLAAVGLTVGYGVSMMKTALLGIKGAMYAARAATLVFNAALWANPITWIIAAILALVATGYLLWKNWDKISSWIGSAWEAMGGKVGEVWNGVKETIFGAWESIKGSTSESWESIKGALSAAWSSIKDTASAVWEEIKAIFAGAPQAILDLLTGKTFFRAGQRLFQTLIDGIKSIVPDLVGTVKGAFGKVRDLLPFSDAKSGPFSKLTQSGRAIMETLGKGIESAGTNPLGERIMGAGKGVLEATMGAMPHSGSGGVVLNLTQNISVSGSASREDAEQGASAGAEDLVAALEEALARKKRLGL